MREYAIWLQRFTYVTLPLARSYAWRWLHSGSPPEIIICEWPTPSSVFREKLRMSSTMSRRALLRGAAGLLGTLGAASLLSACVSSQPAAKPAETKPAETKPAETK